MRQVIYSTAQGNAVVNVGDDKPLKRLGKFRSEAEAKAACDAHFAKLLRTAENFEQETPVAFFA